ncbi:MAG: cell division FtsA domain-containing protein, partial [Hyphomicrobiaceae bacterium]
QAQRMAGVSLESGYVAAGVGRSEQMMASCSIVPLGAQVTAQDLARLDAAGRAFAERDEQVVVHLERLQTSVDGTPALASPVGQLCSQLNADFLILTGDRVTARNILHIVGSNSLAVSRLAPSALATALAVTDPHERDTGVTVVDCGGGTTTLVMFAHGHVVGMSTIPVGGNHLTFDIARQLQVPLNEAERIKLECGRVGTAHSVDAKAHDASVADVTSVLISQATRALIRQILTSRASSLLRTVAERLERFQTASAVCALSGQQVVLAGGASRLKGFDGLARELLGRSVRCGRVYGCPDFPEVVQEMPFAAALGLLTLVPKPVVVSAQVSSMLEVGTLHTGAITSRHVASAPRFSVGY